jgi:hypothetical protein
MMGIPVRERPLPLTCSRKTQLQNGLVFGFWVSETSGIGRQPGQGFHFWFSVDALCPIQAASFAAWVGKRDRSASRYPRSATILPQRQLIANNAMNERLARLSFVVSHSESWAGP